MSAKKKSKTAARKVAIGVCGAGGRMGRRIVACILNDNGASLVSAFGDARAHIGADAAELAGEKKCGVLLQAQTIDGYARADAVIDFSSPSGCVKSATLCAQTGAALVVGVTGLDSKQQAVLKKAAKKVPVVFSPNMSVGVNALFELCARAATMLGDFDMEVLEAHHRRKKDAPSGTALKLGEILASSRGEKLSRRAVFARRGKNAKRKDGDIGFAVVRGGDIIGEHRIIFAGAGEQIELTHRSINRDTYAIGALRAAKWAAKAKPGFYDMSPVLSN